VPALGRASVPLSPALLLAGCPQRRDTAGLAAGVGRDPQSCNTPVLAVAPCTLNTRILHRYAVEPYTTPPRAYYYSNT
jgi:hypothetical protein